MNDNKEVELKKIAEYYDEFALEYYESRIISGGRLFNEYIEMPVVQNLIPNGMESKKVLDIGCGIGVYSRFLGMKGANVTAIDISPKMITLAQKNCSDTNVEFINISFQDYESIHKFDLIIGGFMLGYFYDLKKDFRKIFSLMNNHESSCILSMIHPVKLSSVAREDGKYVLDNYFDENSMYKSDFMSDEKEIPLKKWTFNDISDAAYASNLYLDKIVEATPSGHLSNFDKNLLDFYNRCPSVLVVKLKKRK